MAVYKPTEETQAVDTQATEDTQVADMPELNATTFTEAFQREINAGQAGNQNQSSQYQGVSALSALRDTLFKPITSGAVNERISKVRDQFVAIYENAKKTNPQAVKMDFVVAPGNKIANFYGGIILAMPINLIGQPRVAVHLVIVENHMKLQPQTETINGSQFVIANTATNTVTKATVDGVAQLVKYHYGDTNISIADTGFSYIPVEVDLDDVGTMRNILDDASSNLFSYAEVLDGKLDSDVTLAVASMISSNQLRCFANLDEHPSNKTDVNGLPLRSDFSITTVAVDSSTQNQSHQNEALELGRADVFCAPVFAAPAQQMPAYGQTPVTQHYYNNVIIKSLRAGSEIRLTPATAILLIGTTGLLSVNDLWKRAYVPNMHIAPNELDFKDIGALAFEIPQINADQKAGRFNTKTAEFNADQFKRYMSMLFHSQPIYQIDIPDGDSLLGLFQCEANGDLLVRSQCFDVINKLTAGKFAEVYSPEAPMFINTGNRVACGYYKAGDKLKSLDDFDHLAMLNISSGDARMMREFETTEMPNTPPVLRLGMLSMIIDGITNETAVIKHYVNRLTINPVFMTALISALKASKMFPEINNSFARNSEYTRMTADMFAQYAVNPNLIPNLFTNVGYGNQSYGSVQQPYVAPMFRG